MKELLLLTILALLTSSCGSESKARYEFHEITYHKDPVYIVFDNQSGNSKIVFSGGIEQLGIPFADMKGIPSEKKTQAKDGK